MLPLTIASPPRPLTAVEVGVCIRHFRELPHWSQEPLAEIARLNVRIIQRVEQGDSASFDTRRALAAPLSSTISTHSTSPSRCRGLNSCTSRKKSSSASTSPWLWRRSPPAGSSPA